MRSLARLVLSTLCISFAFAGPAPAAPQDPPLPGRHLDDPDLSPEQLEELRDEIRRDFARRVLRESLDAAGLPADTTPVVLTLRQAYELALIRARSPKPIWTGPEARPFDAESLKKASEEFAVSDFQRFRADFLATPEDQPEPGRFRDPSATFLKALTLRAAVDSNREAIELYGSLLDAYKQFAAGVGDISTQNIDQVELADQRHRRIQSEFILRYRNALDDLKEELGLPLDHPVLPDDSDLAAFRETFREFDDWFHREDRVPEDLPRLLGGLPPLPDVRIGDHSPADVAGDPSKLQALLRGAYDPSKTSPRSAKLARRRIRSLLHAREVYPLEQKVYLIQVREEDIAVRSLFSPPRAGHAADEVNRITANLVKSATAACTQRRRLISLWTSYQSDRIALAHLLHQMPGDDWDSFLAPFQARAAGPPKGP